MNERIKQLAVEAGIISAEYNGFDSTGLTKAQRKFAELIVKECLKIVEPDRTSGDEWCLTLDETAQSIRQHFGVEE